MIDSATFGAC